MKVNVAQYLMNDLSDRFPSQNGNAVNGEAIDMLVDCWSKHRYVVPEAKIRLNHRFPDSSSFLM